MPVSVFMVFFIMLCSCICEPQWTTEASSLQFLHGLLQVPGMYLWKWRSAVLSKQMRLISIILVLSMQMHSVLYLFGSRSAFRLPSTCIQQYSLCSWIIVILPAATRKTLVRLHFNSRSLFCDVLMFSFINCNKFDGRWTVAQTLAAWHAQWCLVYKGRFLCRSNCYNSLVSADHPIANNFNTDIFFETNTDIEYSDIWACKLLSLYA